MLIANRRSSLQIALVGGACITLVGIALSLIFPSLTYLFAPGMLIVYVVSGGVHGYASGVYLPSSLRAWYAIGGLVDVLLYALFLFWIVKGVRSRKKNGAL